MKQTRRNFLTSGILSGLGGLCLKTLPAFAQSLHQPLGLQLYSVREELPKDFEGVLQTIGSLGYREVEAAGFFDHPVADVQRAMKSARLNCVSSHYGFGKLSKDFEQILAFNKELGVEYLVCASPAHRKPVPQSEQEIYTLDDWHFLADQLNAFGEKVNAAGMRFAYHNHAWEFSKTDGVIPYTELMSRTEPTHVAMEMDCGWVVAAGSSPVEFLRKYPSRIVMLHVKDFVRPTSATMDPLHYTVTELGRGYIDYRPIFTQAAKSGNIRHIFVEQEAFDIPMKDSLAEDAAYLRRLLR